MPRRPPFVGSRLFVLLLLCLVALLAPGGSGPGILSSDAVVLVNSTSPDYADFEELIQPYLDNFGIPYEVHDIATTELTAVGLERALIIVGHDRLDTALSHLSPGEQDAIAAAVAGGTGLVNFDGVLSDLVHNPLYTYVQDVFPATFSPSGPANDIEIQPAPLHYITERHAPAETIPLKSNMTVLGMTPPGDAEVVATADGAPLVSARSHGSGRVVQWGAYGWISVSVKGPLYGLDDLVWRSLVWAARKPFAMQGMRPMLPMRVDDVKGPLEWLDIAIDEYGFKPWVGVFSRDIDAAEAATLSARANAGEATVSIHSLTGSDFFYMDHWSTWTDWPDPVMASIFLEGTQWHQSNGIPISKLVVPHLYEIGTNAFPGLSDWGVEFIETQMEPGNLYQAPWLQLGPYRLFESGNSGDVEPHFYADFMEIPNHPELDGQFFNCVTEIRDDAGYEWFPSNDVPTSVARGTRQSRRAFDSMVLATLFTHEYHIDYIDMLAWRSILDGITTNLASYQPELVTLDYACQYVRAVTTSDISHAEYDPVTRLMTATVAGDADIDTQFYLFYTEEDGSIGELRVDVPTFTGSAQVVTSVPGACTGECIASVTLTGLAQSFDGTPRVVTATTDPIGLPVDATYDGSPVPPIAVGSYAVVGTVNDIIYTGSASGTLVVSPGSASVSLGGLFQAYDGTPKSATVTTVPAGLSVQVTYDGAPTPPTAVGSYAVVATVSDPSYTGTASGTLIVSADPLPATVTLGGLSQSYDGTPRVVTATTVPPGLPVQVTYDGVPTPPTAVGSYAVLASVTDPSYSGSAAGTLVVDPGAAVVTLSGLGQVYDGTPRVVTATTVPPGLSVEVTYDGSPTPPAEVGSYAVIASVTDPNYVGSASGTLIVDPDTGPPDFCETAPASSAHFCDDFEDGVACTDAGRAPRYTSLSGPSIDCASDVGAIEGAYSMEITTTTADDQLHCDDGGGTGCFGAALQGVTCTRFSLRVDDEGTSSYGLDLLVPRSAGDSENFSFTLNPKFPAVDPNLDVIAYPNGVTLPNAMSEGAVKVWCIEQDFDAFETRLYSGSDCGTTQVAAAGWNWEGDHGGFRVRAYLDNANLHIDNIAVHQGDCGSVWSSATTVTLVGLSQQYDGTPRVVTATTEPAGLPVAVTYDGSPTPPTAVGSYAVVASVTDPNFTGSASGTLVLSPAPATVTLGALAQTYDGTPRVATAATVPSGLAVDLTYDGSPSPPTGVGSYAVVGTVNDPNHTGSASGTLVVSPASASVTLGALAQTYDGTPRVATAVTVPSGLAVDLTYDGSPTAPTDAGSYAVVASVTDPNHTGSASGTLVVSQAGASVTLGALAQTYDGTPRVATAVTVPSGLAVDLTYDGSPSAPTNVGSYAVVATVTNPNHTGSASGTLVVSQSGASVTLGALAQTYDGTPRVATAATVPSGLVVDLTYDGSPTAPTGVGSYAVVGTVNDPNHTGSASGTMVVSPAGATVSLSGLSQEYDGTPRVVTVTTVPSGLAVDVTYDGSPSAPTEVGSYAVVATVNDPNHTGSASGTLAVSAQIIDVTVTLSGLGQVYDGTPRVATATSSPAGVTVDLTYDGSPTAPTDAGSYAVVATVNQAGYAGSASGTLVVSQAGASVTLGALAQTYDGTPRVATAATVPSGLAVDLTYDGSPGAPTNVGSYAVVGTVNDPNHTGSASGTLVVSGGGGGTAFCDTAPASSAQFCDDFEAGLTCTSAGRDPEYTSQAGSAIDCASPASPIDGSYSLEFTTGTADEQLHCDDGGGTGCFGPALQGVTCTRFAIRVDDEGTQRFGLDVMVPRSAGDSENFSFMLNPKFPAVDPNLDVIAQPNGVILANAMTEGAVKVWCIEQDFDGFDTRLYSGSDCGATEVGSAGWNWESDHGGFRIRALLDDANVHMDNITVHQGACQAIW